MISLIAPLVVLAFTLSSLASPTRHNQISQRPLDDGSIADRPRKVNVAMYVMSRCPDARLCEDIFEDVLTAENMTNKIDLSLNFVAHSDHSESLGVRCMHGPLECIGNAHDLCLHKHLPLPDFYAALSCQNFQTPFPGDIGKIELTRRCAETANVDWWKSGVGECIEGKATSHDGYDLGREAHRLLLKNVKGTEDKGVTKSCTIEIASTLVESRKRVCLVDGGVWTGCDDGHTAADFVRVIEEEWENLR